MANENFKEIKTRISLRWLDFATWSAEAFQAEKPLKGEVWFCEVPNGNANAQTAPTVLFKVGDGVNTFGNLKWTSALAADVYNWAKAANVVFENEHILFKDAAGGTIKDLDLSAFALDAHLGNVTNLTTTAKTAVGAINEHDAEIGDLTKLNTTNKGNLVAALNEALQAVEVGGTGSVVTVTKATTPTTGSQVTYTVNQGGKPVDVKIEIPKYATSADYGVLGVTAGNDTITVGGTKQNPTVAVTANKFDAYGAAAQALVDAKAYADAKPHENTAHTHSAGTGTKVSAAGGLTGNVAVNLNVEFAELGTDKILKLVDKDSKAVIAQFDATDFVVDGMLKSVTADQTNNTLTFEWNTDSGKTQTTVIELSKIADIYTGSNGADINVTVSNNNQISAALSLGVWNAINSKANAAELGDLALKDTITHDLVTDFDAEVAKIKVTNATNADKLDGKAASDFATNAENGAKALADQNKLAIDAINNANTGILAQAKKDASDKAAVVLSEAQKYADNKVGGLHAIASSGSIYDVEECNTDENGVTYFILDCNW